MEDLLRKDRIVELIIVTGVSFLLFQLSFVFFLFIVPVFYIGRKRGWHAAVIAALVLFIAIALQLTLRIRTVENTTLRRFVTIYGLSYPVLLLVGALIVAVFSGRSMTKILAATGLFAVVSIPVILIYSGNNEVVSFLKEQISYVAGMFTKGLSKSSSGDASVLLNALQPAKLMEMIRVIFFRDFIAAYFLLLTGTWYIADLISSRKNKSERFSIAHFTVPEQFIWVLIVSLSGVLADHLFSLGMVGNIFWNSSLILLFIYGINGLGLVKHLFKKYKVTQQKQRSLYILIFILLIIPGMNLVVLLGIPGLGISELWVRYR